MILELPKGRHVIQVILEKIYLSLHRFFDFPARGQQLTLDLARHLYLEGSCFLTSSLVFLVFFCLLLFLLDSSVSSVSSVFFLEVLSGLEFLDSFGLESFGLEELDRGLLSSASTDQLEAIEVL